MPHKSPGPAHNERALALDHLVILFPEEVFCLLSLEMIGLDQKYHNGFANPLVTYLMPQAPF
jgi:hypothetical protein